MAKKIDCRLYAICKLIKLNDGETYSPNELLGLGAGLEFDYYISKNIMPLFSVVGRDFKLEEKLIKDDILPISTQTIENRDELEYMLKNSVPFMLNVDRYYLDYLNIENAHFGYHAIIVLGEGSCKTKVRIMDALVDGVVEVSFDTILKAVFSETKIFPTEKKAYVYNQLSAGQFMKHDYFKSIMVQCKKILNNNNYKISRIARKMDELPFQSYHIKQKYLEYQWNHLLTCFREQDFEGTFYRKAYYDWLASNFNLELKGDAWVESWKNLGQIRVTEARDVESLIKKIMNQICICEREEKNFFSELKKIVERGEY